MLLTEASLITTLLGLAGTFLGLALLGSDCLRGVIGPYAPFEGVVNANETQNYNESRNRNTFLVQINRSDLN